MRFKTGVKAYGVQPPTTLAMHVMDELFVRETGDEMVVTSLMDGTHSPKSLHRFGLAFDFRTHDIPQGSLGVILAEFRSKMPGWQVVIEPDHGHVEYDPTWG